jgi:hypothetical protein
VQSVPKSRLIEYHTELKAHHAHFQLESVTQLKGSHLAVLKIMSDIQMVNGQSRWYKYINHAYLQQVYTLDLLH